MDQLNKDGEDPPSTTGYIDSGGATTPSAAQAARGHWLRILCELGGADPALLDGKHHPCPTCGGTDRFRFDDKDGNGTWFCNQCGGKQGTGGSGDGFDLLNRLKEWSFKQAAQEIELLLGLPTRNRHHKPRPVTRKPPAPPSPTPAPITAPIVLARLPEPIPAEELRSPYDYSPRQRIKRVEPRDGGKKFFPVEHRADPTSPWKKGAGRDHWPLFLHRHLHAAAGAWALELEGEKCAGIAVEGGVVATTQPGHARKVEQIATRYAQLRDAGVLGIVYVSDNDKDGEKRAANAIEAAAQAGLPFLHLRAADVWPDIPPGGSIDDAPGTPEERFLDIEAAILEAEAQPPEAETPPEEALDSEPFRLLGRCADGNSYAYRVRADGSLLILPRGQHTALHLVSLASPAFWQALYPGQRGAPDWIKIAADLFARQSRLPPFNPGSIRGRGVWIDEGRVVWHLGDRLQVDGEIIRVDAIRSRFTYDTLPPLPFTGHSDPLDDESGRRILSLIQRMGWGSPLEPINIAAAAVLGPVCGALQNRPQTQITSRFGSGKTAVARFVFEPLWGGEGCCLRVSAATEAFIRQTLGADALPVIVDESEQENDKRRAGILELARLSYDGSPSGRGTTHGQALSYVCRSAFALLGINAGMLNPADRSRFTINHRQPLPASAWADLRAELEEFITPRTGGQLIARTVANLHTLQANIRPLHRVVVGMIGGGTAERLADTYAPILAAVHLLTSTALLDETSALEWLDSIGWSYIDPDAEDLAPEAEGLQCLAHLLSVEHRWDIQISRSGSITIGELVQLAHNGGAPDDVKEARRVLGRRGIKATDMGLAIANSTPGILAMFERTRWAKGAHRDRLAEIPGAERPGSVWIKEVGNSVKVVRIPWSTPGLTAEG
jgi:putative DNA primase/helicase